MVWRFSWCTVVALFVLLFVTTEGLRGHDSQVKDKKVQESSNRGTSKFNPPSLNETASVAPSPASRTKSGRDRTSQSRRTPDTAKWNEKTTVRSLPDSEAIPDSPSRRSSSRVTRTTEKSSVSSFARRSDTELPRSDVNGNLRRRSSGKQAADATKSGPTISGRSDRKYLPEKGERRKTRDNEQDIGLEIPRESFVSRRTSSSASTHSEKLGSKGPSVFVGVADNSRSRTGRKIQTSYASADLQSRLPVSERFTERNKENVESTTIRGRRTESRTKVKTEKVIGRSNAKANRGKSGSQSTGSFATRKPQDSRLSESESVRVDIPLVLGATENPVLTVTTSAPSSGYEVTENSEAVTQRQPSRVITRRSDTKDSYRTNDKVAKSTAERVKNRVRPIDSEPAGSNSRGSSRRGSSKFVDFTTTESSEQIVTPRSRIEGRNSGFRDRSRNQEFKSRSSANESRPRSRGRNVEGGAKAAVEGQDKRGRPLGDRHLPEKRSRTPDGRSKTVENRSQDQDTRARVRNRPRADVTAPTALDFTTTTVPETTISDIVTIPSAEAETMITTTRPVTMSPTITQSARTTPTTRVSSPAITTTTESRVRTRNRGSGAQGRTGHKEDFFNHGLGFRGRKHPPEGSSNAGESKRTHSPLRGESQARGNPGWTLRRRPGHSAGHPAKSETTSKTFAAPSKEQTNEIVPSNEQTTSTDVTAVTVESSTATTRRGLKKQGTEESVTVGGTMAKSTRRGNKTFDKGGNQTAGKGAAEPGESDNYPPDFKARLSQLKNTSPKTTVPKTSTTRVTTEEQLTGLFGRRMRASSVPLESDVNDLEAAASENVFTTDLTLLTKPLTSVYGTQVQHTKKISAALFAERSRMKLELARRLVKPELNIEENDLESTTSTSFSKPRPTDPSGSQIPVVNESRKVAKITEAINADLSKHKESVGGISSGSEGSNESKLSRPRKGLEDGDTVKATTKKGRIISERMVTSISVEGPTNLGIEETTKPYAASTSSGGTTFADAASATTVDSTRIRFTSTRSQKKTKDESTSTTKAVKPSASTPRSVRPTDKGNFVPTNKLKKPRTHSSREGIEVSTTDSEIPTTTIKPRKSYSPSRANKQQPEQRKTKASQEKINFRPRYSKKPKHQYSDEYQTTMTSRISVATSRYTRKKSELLKSSDGKSKVTTDAPATQTKRREFRPRTATYRRHSDVPTTLLGTSAKVGVEITPRSPRYHATVKSSTASPQPVPQEPLVSLRIANDTAQQTTGIIDSSSNGDTGNTNIFNPTRSQFLASNASLLDQLRSTVAPLLSSLGNKSPIFSGSYRNVNSGNSAARITPNGSPPRFSARYKGAELFVRKPSFYQATVPSITSSSSTPATPVESSGSAPLIDVSSPGEPRFVTFYHALESANITNEQSQDGSNSQQQIQIGGAAQVDSNATPPNGIGNSNPNNDTTSPTVATASPQTPDTTVNTIRSDITLSSRLSEETENAAPAVTTAAPPDLQTTPEVLPNSQSTTDAPIETQTTSENPSDIPSTSELPSDAQSTPEAPSNVQSTSEIPSDARSTTETPSDVQSTPLTPSDVQSGSETPSNLDSATESPADTQTTSVNPSDVQSNSEIPSDAQNTPGTETATESSSEASSEIPTTPTAVTDARSTPETLSDAQSTPESPSDVQSTSQTLADVQSTTKTLTNAQNVPETSSDTQTTPEASGGTQGASETPSNFEFSSTTPASDSQSTTEISSELQSSSEVPSDVQSTTEAPSSTRRDVDVETTTSGAGALGNLEVLSRILDSSSGVTGMDVTTTVENQESSSIAPATTVAEADSSNTATTQSNTNMPDQSPSTTVSNNESADLTVQNDASTPFVQNLETSTVAPQTTTPSVSDNDITPEAQSTDSPGTITSTERTSFIMSINSFRRPEIATTQQPESTSTQEASSTDAATTETISNNLVDASTTEVPFTPTIRNRLIDYAPDILSRLQMTISTTTVRSQDPTTTISPSNDISNAIADSSANDDSDNPNQMVDTESTTSLSTESTTVQNIQSISRATTTTAPVTTSAGETTTQNAVGSITTTFTTDQPNLTMSTGESNGPDQVDLTTTTVADTKTVSSTDTTTLTNGESEALLDINTTSQNPENSENSVESLENLSDPPLDAEITTESMTTSRYTTLETDTRTPNDTLLTELMTIAKTLFSEAMNETQQLPSIQNRLSDFSDSVVETSSETLDVSTQTESLVGDNVDRTTLSNHVLGTTQTPDPTSASDMVATTTESIIVVASTIDPNVNEVESNTDFTATTVSLESMANESSTTPQADTIENEVEFVDVGQTTSLALGSPFERLELTTVSPVIQIESETSQIPSTTSSNLETELDTTTQPPTSTTQSTEATVTTTTNFELTTNTNDLTSSNLMVRVETQTTSPGQTTEAAAERAEQTTRLTDTATVTPESVTEQPANAVTNRPPEITTMVVTTVPESILSRVNMFTTPTTSLETITDQTVDVRTALENGSNDLVETSTPVTTTQVAPNVTTDTDTTTNRPIDPTTEVSSNTLSSEIIGSESPETTTPVTTPIPVASTGANLMDVTEAVTNQPSLTIGTEPATDSASNSPTTTEATTNTPDETTTTTNLPQTTPPLENETPTIVARFQDATSTTAQGTAGSGIAQSEQTTETRTPTNTESTSIMPSSTESSMSPLSSITDTTTSSSVDSTAPTTTVTETATSTTTGRLPDERSTTTTVSSTENVVIVTPVSETTVPPTTTSTSNADINENLVSTEMPTDASTTPGTTTASADSVNVISRVDNEEGVTMIESTTGTTTAATTPTTPSTTMSSTQVSSQMPSTMFTGTRPAVVPQNFGTTPYLGRFGGSRLTPAPRFSSSSTTKAPLRDYHIYGIYPNKTIVRKRPEDNLIDARNVDSPYVIFGIYPDGRLVRKFPNGTIIPDPPRSPVEVVFSLSTTTTTNRPPPRPYFNQANQGTYSQYQAPAYSNSRSPVAELMRNVQSPGTIDLGLTGNAIVGPNGGGPDFTGPLGTPASVATANKMSDVLLNTRMGTTPNVVSAIAGMLTPNGDTGAQVRPPTDSQGGRIVEDRERDEATRTREAGGQRSSVYIGQDKFVNYWTGASPSTNPRVVSVRINSVASAANEGPSSSSGTVPSFDNLLNNQSGGQVTASPGNPWRDPLDQIFGITTSSPVITASVSSNSLDDSEPNGPIVGRPINPFVEVFTPVSGNVANIQTTAMSSGVSSTTPTMAPTTTTTTMPPTTTTTTTTMAPTTTTTTTTMAPTTTTTTTTAPTTTTTSAPTTNAAPQPTSVNTVAPTSQSATTGAPATTPASAPNNLAANGNRQNAFGSTFDDLAFLNSLLQSPNAGGTTPKTLTQVEQLLANKILSLALNNPGSARAPKAIDVGDAFINSLAGVPARKRPSEPIVIDLFPSSTATAPTWKPAATQHHPGQKSVESGPAQVTWKPVSSSTAATKRDTESSVSTPSAIKTTPISTSKPPIVITAKSITTPRPRATTTEAPAGFGASLWQALFGGGLFGGSTAGRTPRPVAKPAKTVTKSVSITPKPFSSTEKVQPVTEAPNPTTQKSSESVQKIQVAAASQTTPRTVDISQIRVVSPTTSEKSTNIQNLSTTSKPLLNNPNPRLPDVPTSTYSPDEDAKFLAALLRALQTTDTPTSTSKSTAELTEDDELFLRAILSGQGRQPTATTASPNVNGDALLAAVLKAQGIEPSTPPNQIREQLQLASLGQSVTSAPSASTTTGRTTTATRPATTTTQRTVTTKKTVTARPTSRPRPRTTTWSPSSTYPPPLFSSFSNYATPVQSTAGENSGNSGLFGATRAFSQFLGAAITGAAQQLQSFVRNGTRIVSDAVVG